MFSQNEMLTLVHYSEAGSLHCVLQCTVFCCRRCDSVITQKNDIFSMSVEGPLGAYVNPGGHVHEMLTVAQTRGLRLIGRPTVENSWFDGSEQSLIIHCLLAVNWQLST